MDAKANGAQAAHPIDPQVEIDVTGGIWGSLGLTKRELFAAMAMQGLLARGTLMPSIAMRAVENADALLAELAKATP